MSNGKGSRSRTTNHAAYRRGWDRIFGKKKKKNIKLCECYTFLTCDEHHYRVITVDCKLPEGHRECHRTIIREKGYDVLIQWTHKVRKIK